MDNTTTKMDKYNALRKQQVNDKKQEVIESALTLFLETNITEVSMNDIAKKAGISRATMYRYFADKEEIVFILASLMMEEIYKIAFCDVSFESSSTITQGYRNMVTRFDDLVHAYEYIAMFDSVYTKAHPSKELTKIYSEEFNQLLLKGKENLNEEETIRHIMMLNLTMDFLEDLAIHRDLIPITQGVPIELLLNEFAKTIDSIMKI